jgi:tetratricopeptide (TPR) repeat protein
VWVQVALGNLFESRGNWQQAQRWYEKALSIQPEDAVAANNLAYLLLEHDGNINVALTLAQTARRGLPNQAKFCRHAPVGLFPERRIFFGCPIARGRR